MIFTCPQENCLAHGVILKGDDTDFSPCPACRCCLIRIPFKPTLKNRIFLRSNVVVDIRGNNEIKCLDGRIRSASIISNGYDYGVWINRITKQLIGNDTFIFQAPEEGFPKICDKYPDALVVLKKECLTWGLGELTF